MDSLEEYSPALADNGPDLMDVRISDACIEEAPPSNLFGPIGIAQSHFIIIIIVIIIWLYSVQH